MLRAFTYFALSLNVFIEYKHRYCYSAKNKSINISCYAFIGTVGRIKMFYTFYLKYIFLNRRFHIEFSIIRCSPSIFYQVLKGLTNPATVLTQDSFSKHFAHC
jgi:hypothetical protein